MKERGHLRRAPSRGCRLRQAPASLAVARVDPRRAEAGGPAPLIKEEPRDLSGRSLLAVFAHPDDESLSCGGLFAWCSSLGAHVSLCCATRGELGPWSGKERALVSGPARLREARVQELRAASRVLGVADIVLLDYEDGMLPWVDAERLEADLLSTICRLRPHVVITFGEDGLYWHPDHIAIHERTTAAVAALGQDAPALFYVTMPAGCMRAIVHHAEETRGWRGARGQSPRRILGIADPDAFGALAAPPTLVLDVGRFAARKLAAIRCHRTQLEHDALALLDDSSAARLLGTEQFHRAGVGSRGDAFIERFASNLRSLRELRLASHPACPPHCAARRRIGKPREGCPP